MIKIKKSSSIGNQNVSDEDHLITHLNNSLPEITSNRLKIWIWLSLLMGLFFATAAYVQHNDPDPYLWIPAYLIPAGITWTVALKLFLILEDSKKTTRIPKNYKKFHNDFLAEFKSEFFGDGTLLDRLIAIQICYSFVLGFYTLSHYIYINHILVGEIRDLLSKWTSEEMMMIEEGKELLGLCLIIIWLLLLKDYNFIKLGHTGLLIGLILTAFPFISWAIVQFIEKQSDTKCH